MLTKLLHLYNKLDIMLTTEQIMMPKAAAALAQFGENLRLARLRRRISASLMAQRAGISRMTLYNVEQGKASVAIGAYVQVMFALGMYEELATLTANDPLGRKLQDLEIAVPKRAPKRIKQTVKQ